MSEYLHSGWHEFLIPVTLRGGHDHLRVWIDMEDVVPMLRRLDTIYGDVDHPYALRPEEIPDAQRTLLGLVAGHALQRPDAVRRVSGSRRIAAELAERFGVGPSPYPLAYPEAIDQVDLDPAQVALVLPAILDRHAAPPPERPDSP